MKKTLKKIAGDKKWQEVNKNSGQNSKVAEIQENGGKIWKWQKFKKMAGIFESGGKFEPTLWSKRFIISASLRKSTFSSKELPTLSVLTATAT